MLLMIDNYDSFTYNLVQYFQELGVQVTVYYNDQITIPDVLALQPKYLVISPGPGSPEKAGIIIPLIKSMMGRLPILGVCLGHQAIGLVFGARVILADEVRHGKTSSIFHRGDGLFREIASPFRATRYHSLLLDKEYWPVDLEVTAWTQKETSGSHEIMGIRHRSHAIAGIQFHPESILTEFGHHLLSNFLQQAIIDDQKCLMGS